MFLFGDGYWGKVDWVPGLFFVKTRFVHVGWIPIVPRESWLFRDENAPPPIPLGKRIPLRWKSVLLAWLQSFLFIAIIILVFAICGLMAGCAQQINMDPETLASIIWTILISSIVLYCFSRRRILPTLPRAIELGEILGMSPEEVRLHFKIVR